MSHIPSLEYRGRQHPVWVRIGQVLLSSSIVQFLLRIVDSVGRGESAMDIYAHLPRLLHFIGNPYFPVIVMAAGLFILWCQGWKSQLQPPKSVLIHGITKEPFQLKYRMWPSLRHALWACVWALVIVVPAVVVYKSPIRNFIFVEPLPVYAKVPPPPPTLIKVGGPTPVPSAATSGHYKKQITQSLPSVPVQNNMLPKSTDVSTADNDQRSSRNEPSGGRGS